MSTASTASTEHPAPVDSHEVKITRANYIEIRDDWEFCTLCKRYATSGHLESENHKYRVEMTEWEAAWEDKVGMDGRPIEGPPEWFGNPDYYEWRDGWRWWCRLCHQWANAGHVQGNKHLKRAAWAEWNPDDIRDWADNCMARSSAPRTSSSSLRSETNRSERTRQHDAHQNPALDPWGPDWKASPSLSKWYEAWSEEYKRPYFYNIDTLAQSWDPPPEGLATQAVSVEGGENLAGNGACSQRRSCEEIPPPWQKEWSEEHKRHFYWNRKTNESRWVLPGWADEWC